MTVGAALPTGPSTTAQHALDHLRAAIVSGALAPGAHVRQEQIADELGVSIAPVREALRLLEREGQVTYVPRRGYTVTKLNFADLEEIYALRQLIETRAARAAVMTLDEDALERIEAAARECVDAVKANDIAQELSANRRFHLALLESPGHPHTMQVIRTLWDSTEAYRGLYYAVGVERRTAIDAHDRILAALREGDTDGLVAELDSHRQRALDVLAEVLGEDSGGGGLPIALGC